MEGIAFTALYVGPFVGGCLLAAGVGLQSRARKRASCLCRVSGTVRTNVRGHSVHSDGEMFRVVVEYKVGGKTFTVKGQSLSGRKANPGAGMDVLYDPGDPRKAILAWDHFMISRGLVTLGVFTIFFFSIFWLNHLFIGSL